MAILEKEVLVRLNNNHKYYEILGYQIPKYRGHDGKYRAKKGTEILVSIKDLPEGSNCKVTKICDFCGIHFPDKPYSAILKSRKNGDGKDRCFKCSKNYIAEIKLKNVKYEKSLEYWAIKNNKQYLLKEFSSNNDKTARDISYGSSYEYEWKCSKCNEFYNKSVGYRTMKQTNCPYCAGRVVNDKNCLWNTHPRIAEMLYDETKGYNLTYGSAQKADFLCSKCKCVSEKTVADVVFGGFSCPKCSDGRSYPEKFMFSLLEQLNIKFEREKTFRWSDNKRYDFYISELNMIIETHGNQHYCDTSGKRGRSLVEEQENDRLKMQLAKENKITSYIVIDCRESDLKYIKQSILKSKISKLYDFSKVNWLKCHESACSNTVKKTCELWNSGVDILDISKEIKVHRATVIRHLKKGNLLGWCKYDPNEEKSKNGIKNGKRNGKVIVQLSLENDIIREWKSATEACSILKTISNASITSCCKGKTKTAGGYKWMYKEEYDQYIKQVK